MNTTERPHITLTCANCGRRIKTTNAVLEVDGVGLVLNIICFCGAGWFRPATPDERALVVASSAVTISRAARLVLEPPAMRTPSLARRLAKLIGRS